jgi:hypothetical protein
MMTSCTANDPDGSPCNNGNGSCQFGFCM